MISDALGLAGIEDIGPIESLGVETYPVSYSSCALLVSLTPYRTDLGRLSAPRSFQVSDSLLPPALQILPASHFTCGQKVS